MPAYRVLSFALILVAFVIPRETQAMDDPCIPTSIKPNLDAMEVKNVASVTGQVVANMVGYVQLLDNNITYLPVSVDRVFINKLDSSGMVTVALSSECATFNINYKVATGNQSRDNYYAIKNMEMFVEGRGKFCNFELPFAFKLDDTETRYSCRYVISHQCALDWDQKARLVLKSFEFELDGQPQSASRRQFSKKPWFNSCDQWDW